MIERVDSFVVPYTEVNDHDSTRYACLVQITAADGTVGWGEAATIFAPAARATAVIVDGLAPLLLGQAADPGSVRASLEHQGWWYADSGIARFALSAIDIALWDLAGRASGRTLSDLVGRRTDSLPIVVSCHATDRDLDLMSRSQADVVHGMHATGIKVAYGKAGEAALGVDHDRDVEFIRLLRAALGAESLIMIDIAATLHWTPEVAIERIRAFEEYGVYWTEEPLGADNIAGYALLQERVNSMIAYGEREWSPAGYRRIIDSGTVDVVGIDPGRVGGISAFLDVNRLLVDSPDSANPDSANPGSDNPVQGNAHAFAGPLIFAASLALSLSSNRFRQLEVTPGRNTLFDLCTGVPEIVDGRIRPGSAPGLGVEIDQERVRARSE